MQTLKHHFTKHHKKYLLGIFGGRAIFKTIILIIGLFGVVNYELQINKTYAADALIVRDGGGATNNWSDANNRAGDVVPGSTDTAIFDSTSTKNANIDTNINVGGIDIQTGYIGTIIQDTGVNLTVEYSGFTQSDGTFHGGNGNATFYDTLILNSGTFIAPSGTMYLIADPMQYLGPYANSFIYYNDGIFDANNGTIEFNNGYFYNNVVLHKSLELNNVNINAGNDWTVSVINSGYDFNVDGTLMLTDGTLGDGSLITAKGDVIVQPTYAGGGAGKILVDTGNNVTVASGSKTPVFIGGMNMVGTFIVNTGANVYFGSDMRIATLDLSGATALHSNTSMYHISTAISYDYSIDPILDHIIICTPEDSFVSGYEMESDRSCPGLANPTYSSVRQSWGLMIGNVYDIIFNFINNLGRLTNQDHLLTPRHFRAPVPNGLADGAKNTLQLKVKFFTQP